MSDGSPSRAHPTSYSLSSSNPVLLERCHTQLKWGNVLCRSLWITETCSVLRLMDVTSFCPCTGYQRLAKESDTDLRTNESSQSLSSSSSGLFLSWKVSLLYFSSSFLLYQWRDKLAAPSLFHGLFVYGVVFFKV